MTCDRPLKWPNFVAEAMKDRKDQWIFRGGLSDWKPHQTSIERVQQAWGISPKRMPELECRLVRDFQRHPEARSGPPLDHTLEWLALMQHHGAPTRLLDWTYSPFVAAFFALRAFFEHKKNRHRDTTENSNRGRTTPEVWAINTDWLERRIERVLRKRYKLYVDKKDPKKFKALYLSRTSPRDFVGTATPMVLNQRLSVQQGVFLCLGNIQKSWEDNLTALANGQDRSEWEQTWTIAETELEEAIDALHAMNISARSLFPGLDGYAESAGHRAKHLLELRLPGGKNCRWPAAY